eukprot:981565-Rhodomonas_salina.2
MSYAHVEQGYTPNSNTTGTNCTEKAVSCVVFRGVPEEACPRRTWDRGLQRVAAMSRGAYCLIRTDTLSLVWPPLIAASGPRSDPCA